MAKSKKFPKLIHVTYEGEGDEAYHSVYTDGVQGIDENGKEVAVYQLIEKGRVTITKKFGK